MNITGDFEFVCWQNMDTLVLEWLNLFNSSIVPFILMFLLSIILVNYVRLSSSKSHGSDNNASSSRLKRDNRLTITVISLNLIFIVLNLPIFIYHIVAVYTEPPFLLQYSVHILYYSYYASSFYTQLVVNRDFRNEFFKTVRIMIRSVSNAVSYISG